MISFYPGPSRVYPKTQGYMRDAFEKGILSINHRSPHFISISKRTVTLLRDKLSIPKNYAVYFVSSATECWEIIAQSFTGENIHIFSGAFGKKWYDATSRLKPGTKQILFDRNDQLIPEDHKYKTGNLICLTQNETSNGTQLSKSILRKIKRNNPEHLIAIDATSSMAGISLDFKSADIWFASVQKCFGVPAGLGILICSPRAIERALHANKRTHYNNILALDDMMRIWQTPCTPNVLGIYLLMRVLENIKPIAEIEKTILSRYKKWEVFFDKKSHQLNFLITNKTVRSNTVLTIEAKPSVVRDVKMQARKAGFLLGDGYGDLKATTFRIANFPAIQRTEIARLMDFLYDYI